MLLYKIYLIGEFEIPKSNISLYLVKNTLYKVENLKNFDDRILQNFIEKYIERSLFYITNNKNILKISRKTVIIFYKVKLKLNDM
ncbi:hypothetical protein RCL_jg10806.t1 [Rhizophagus clarus]|uniref:Uncharacterized protein n=1 Tax=Rhizophagus clarus TaxID=94130 RepID=A0A8H3QIE1_9GLOM|nr:hypothetical protein RCL_jg10806.t1 [Rhizophagus clarus]